MKLVVRALTFVVLLFGSAGLTLWAQQGTEAERVKQRFIGSYKLISYTSYDQSGAATKLPYAVGQISYDAANRMSAQLMREDTPATAPATTPATAPGAGAGAPPAAGGGRGGAGAGRGAGNNGYIAYLGHYEIDVARGVVTHFVEGSISPNMLGTGMPRWYEFTPDGNTLFLMTKQGDRMTGRLQWDRFK